MTIILYALVVWFGAGNAQSSFAVAGITDRRECERLGHEMAKDKGWVQTRCYPYRSVK